MRKERSIYNSIAGVLNRVINIMFVFIVRHYFAIFLDNELIGLEGLFSNILGLFSLVDFGLGNAITFNLYEPLHKNERETISAIMKLYKKLYALIGVVIFVLSCIMIPFIANFIKDTTITNNDIRLYFLIYAIGVSVTYFFSYKRTLIFALQKNYKVLNVDTISKIVLSILQIVTIIVYKNYYLYLCLIVIINLSGNIVISRILDKENLFDAKTNIDLPKSFKQKLKDHVKALAVTNVAWQGIASTDNIIISSVVGVLELAKNANYSTISTSINSIFSVVLGGASASIGDMLVEKNKEKTIKYFDRYCFIHAIISSYAFLGVLFISDSVITLWVGEQLMFDRFTVVLISSNIFLTLNFRPLADFQNYSGNFVYYKRYSVIALAINIFTSIVLGKLMGIGGVFVGTSLTYIFMICVVVMILSKRLFNFSPIRYIKKMVLFCLPLVFSYILISLLIGNYNISNIVFDIVLKILIVTIIFGFFVIVVLFRNEEFQFFKSLVIRMIKNRSIKNL